MKRIVTVQDISCLGKCSLTVALPIISACGAEAVVLPTAVLSNHTAFKEFTFRDLTDDLEPITKKWKKENISFDAIYTGYLGSFRQIEIVKNLIKDFKRENTIVLIDPAMADNGALYKGFNPEFAAEMASLCKAADVIVPNLTEAAFMLNIPYVAENYDENYVKSVLYKLTELGAKTAVLTGISLKSGELGAYGYDSVADKFFYYSREKLPVNFHGTGDIFASAMCGALAIGKSIEESNKIAVDYTVESMIKTMEDKNHEWYGVNFEQAIPYLVEKLKQI